MKKLWDTVIKDMLFLYCGIFTFITILNSILYLNMGVYEDPSGNWHELDRAIIVLIGVLAFALCKYLKIKNVLFRCFGAYVPSLLLSIGYVWNIGLREPLAKSAYQDIFINFTGMFIIIAVIVIIPEIIHKRRK